MGRAARRGAGAQPRGPYLAGALRAEFDAWLAATVARFVPPLVFREVRKGVQALSSLYVERRGEGELAARARSGSGKRAALATYYAPLHFLAVHHALARIGPARLGVVERLIDLGCGTGAAGAAVACAFEKRPETLAVDCSGFALAEARRTHAAFGIPARTRRGALPGAASTPRPGELVFLGWTVNELDDAERRELLTTLAAGLAAGARLLVVEPLAGRVAPWWPAWREHLAPLRVQEHRIKLRLVLPEWIARLDRAAGLDHGELGARLLAGPLRPDASGSPS